MQTNCQLSVRIENIGIPNTFEKKTALHSPYYLIYLKSKYLEKITQGVF